MNRALTVVLGVIVGLLVVLGVAAALVTFAADDDRVTSDDQIALAPLEPSAFPAVDHDDQAALDLIDAWTRWRTATFVSSGTWTRTLDAEPDAPLVADVYTAQQRPRRYQVRFNDVVEIAEAEVFDDRLVNELVLVGGYVVGEGRLYDVAAIGDGCFHAELIVAALASPWGRWAEYCFDDQTGALESARIRRQSAVDIERHDAIRAEVDDSDFGPLAG